MNIAVVGTGYVGLITGACFADMGTRVTCVDVDEEKISKLKRGEVPIFEPGLEELLKRNIKAGRLFFSTDISEILKDQEVVFSAVGTPPLEDGSADLKYVLEVARTIGKYMDKYLVMVTKSTVPVGTAQKVKNAIQEEQKKRGVNIPFDVVSNPEFLKEGNAIKDFMCPDRIVVGVESSKAESIMRSLYKPFIINNHPLMIMDIASAEMTKYAANSMLATRISFMNEIANLCEEVGADFDSVRKGIGADPRIGNRFLYAGCGYGGSCFPKDVKALINTGRQNGVPMQVIEAVESANEEQKLILYRKLKNYFEGQKHISLKGLTIAIWGLSFKPGTNDMREAPSLKVIYALLEEGVNVRVYDPEAMQDARKWYLQDKVYYAKDMYDCAKGADALVVVTEWKEFKLFDKKQLMSSLKSPNIFDGRSIYDMEELKSFGFNYICIGKKPSYL
ncbi:MAG TPA: UDP-glucose 6-dehydrogenase [Porphyromonadaceae bacterium]|nr:UDP-glucose 6-dehydrogenase [Porphyromonadaceae bacterium]